MKLYVLNNQELIDSASRIRKESFEDVFSIIENAEDAFIKLDGDSSLRRRALKRL